MDEAKLLSPSSLAFVGDAVYSLLVRTALSKINRPSGELHNLAVKYVNANAQQTAYEIIKNDLNETEISVFKRGRNFHTNNTPKNSNKTAYHTATGLETLFGYLYLSEQKERINFLFSEIWEAFRDTL